MTDIDASYIEFCSTEKQKEILKAFIEEGGVRAAARRLDCDFGYVSKTLKKIKRRACKHESGDDKGMISLNADIDIDIDGVIDILTTKHVSELEDADGNIKLRWNKKSVDKDKALLLHKAIIESLSDSITPQEPIKKSHTAHNNLDLLNAYFITDYHLGELCDHEETGDADWDLKIAEDLLVRWFKYSIERSPPACTGILVQLGDCLHFDSLLPITPTSNHILDADSRYYKVVRATIRIFRRVINMMLNKYEKVIVIMAEGNHDLSSSVWLRESFNVFYEDEPRVYIDTNPSPYYAYEHGQTSLFFHHSHLKKLNGLDVVFASKFRDIFGRTKYSYGHCGHLHHTHIKESNLMILEQHRTLAPNDSYSSRRGFTGGREAKVITYSNKYGKVAELCVTPEMVG